MSILESINSGLAEAHVPIRLSDLRGEAVDGVRVGEVALTFDGPVGGERIVVPAVIFEVPLTRRMAERFVRDGALVVAQQVPPSVADMLRRSGTGFVDQRGNCYYEDGRRLIDIRGRVGGPTQKRGKKRQSRALNLFTPRRAQVAALILSYPRVLELPVEEIARTSGVSFGTAANALKVFVETGYLSRYGSNHVLARDRLDTFLDAWADAFPAGLAAHLEIFRGDGDISRLAGKLDGAWVSGEAAIPEKVRGGNSIHLYIEDSQKLTRYLRQGRLRFSGSGGIVMRSVFWDLGRLLPAGMDSPVIDTVVGSLPRVPLALLYADLRGSGDPRLSEISETISRRLKEEAWYA